LDIMAENPYEPPKTGPESADHPSQPGCGPALLATLQIAAGFVAGFSIWAATAPQEAWDANNLYSLLVLLSGLIASFGRQRGFYWGIAGVYFGQVAALHLLIPVGGGAPIMPAFLAVLFFGTLPAAIGAFIGAGLGLATKVALKGFIVSTTK
jgi:hypothetical protein